MTNIKAPGEGENIIRGSLFDALKRQLKPP